MAPPRPATFERPDLENKRSFIKQFLPQLWLKGYLPSSEFLNRITKAEEFWRMVYRVHVENNDAEDEEWQPHALLGQGGFGSVGVWKKRNPIDGAVVDELAIKTMHCETVPRMQSSLWGLSADCHGLLAEAVIQRQLNDSACENIVHLRGYKYFMRNVNVPQRPGPSIALDKEFRLYLEYAPYDTLDSLRLKYRYHHQYLPEAFLWHVFDSLAFAAATVRQCPQQGLPYPDAEKAPRGNASLVHFDLKLENIFLGYREPYGSDDHRGGTRFYDYPVIKLGDFGLMEFVNQDNDESKAASRNPRYYLAGGTPGRRAPELVHYGAYWPQPPNGPYIGLGHYQRSPFVRVTGSVMPHPHDQVINDPQNLTFKLSEKVDVWAIGKVMFDLMGLHNASKLWRLATSRHDRYQSFGHHMISDFTRVPFAKYGCDGKSPYSLALTQLVADCLRPNIDSRVDVTHLLASTRAGIRLWDDFRHTLPETSARMPGDTTHPKLFWRANDINDMPEGCENFPTRFKEYLKMQQRVRSDPDWPHLRPPFDRRMGPPHNRTHHELYLLKYLSRDWRRFRNVFIDAWGDIKLKPGGHDDALSDPDSPDDDSGDSEDDFWIENDGGLTERDGHESDENDQGRNGRNRRNGRKRSHPDEAELGSALKKVKIDSLAATRASVSLNSSSGGVILGGSDRSPLQSIQRPQTQALSQSIQQPQIQVRASI